MQVVVNGCVYLEFPGGFLQVFTYEYVCYSTNISSENTAVCIHCDFLATSGNCQRHSEVYNYVYEPQCHLKNKVSGFINKYN